MLLLTSFNFNRRRLKSTQAKEMDATIFSCLRLLGYDKDALFFLKTVAHGIATARGVMD